MSKNKYNKCKRCDHYCDNGTCQIKKCSTNNPYVNIFDRWFCSYFRKENLMSKCLECKYYDKEKHNCPFYCQLIRETLNEAISFELEQIKAEIENPRLPGDEAVIRGDRFISLTYVLYILNKHGLKENKE